jgi:hypothetical protein
MNCAMAEPTSAPRWTLQVRNLTQLRQLKAKYFFPDGGIVVAASWRGLILSNRNVVKTKLPSRLW